MMVKANRKLTKGPAGASGRELIDALPEEA
jgi:hypothetical protein